MHVSLCDLRDIFDAAQCNAVLPVTPKFKTQEYPTEPLRKISALRAVLELAGKF